MDKPILEILVTAQKESSSVLAVFDSGSFYSFLREDKAPRGAYVHGYATPRAFKVAGKGARLIATGGLPVILTIGDRMVDDVVLVSPDLSQEMLVGCGTMQKWDISIVTRNGRTEVNVGRDMRDPILNEL
jgi:hypothetical protein